MLTSEASRVMMAQASPLDAGVLFLIVVAACFTSGSPSSGDPSQTREVLELKVSGPSSGGGVQAEARPPAESHPPSSRRRAKRCTCYTYKDKECVYYCHLDIIWINTPEHTVPYGMSSYQRPVRRRRWAGPGRGRRGEAEPPRCVCWLQTDSSCSSFCMHRSRRRPL